MQVNDLDLSPAVLLEPDDTLATAAREMEENGLSAVVILEGGNVAGILTERDLVRAAADGAQFSQTPLDEYMTAAPVTLDERASTDEAVQTMIDGEFRHVPILNDEDDVVGVVTLKAVVKALLPATR